MMGANGKTTSSSLLPSSVLNSPDFLLPPRSLPTAKRRDQIRKLIILCVDCVQNSEGRSWISFNQVRILPFSISSLSFDKRQIGRLRVMDHTAEQDQEQEHEVYGGDIPDEGEMDADVEMARNETKDDENNNSKDLEDTKKRLKEIEEEAGALREMQAKVEKEMGSVQDIVGVFLKLKKPKVAGMGQYH